MRFSTLVSSAFVGIAAAAPAPSTDVFPLSDGFPSPSPAQIKGIEKLAGGALPGGALAKQLTPLAAVSVQLIALNEIFEVAYFSTLLSKIHSGAKGFTFHDKSAKQYAVETFTAIRAQEELHALGANAILATASQKTVAPCKFAFPPTSYGGAVALANTFTDVVLSVLPDAQLIWAKDNNDELPYVKLLGTIIAQEGEQNGWFRAQQGKVPSAAPFLTTSGPSFAFSFLTSVVVGPCPAVDLIHKSIPIYPPLTVASKPKAKDETVTFTVKGKVTSTGFSIVYLTGQNLPISEPIFGANYNAKTDTTTFHARLNFHTDIFAKGLTVAAVVKGPSKKYADASEVAANTVYGPGIIEID